jgi:hypothetical protein
MPSDVHSSKSLGVMAKGSTKVLASISRVGGSIFSTFYPEKSILCQKQDNRAFGIINFWHFLPRKIDFMSK